MQNFRVIHIAVLLSFVLHGFFIFDFSGLSSAGKTPTATPSRIFHVQANLSSSPSLVQPEPEQQSHPLAKPVSLIELKNQHQVKLRRKTNNNVPVKHAGKKNTVSTATQPAAPLQDASIASMIETRQTYISQVLEQIEKNKSYPLQARRSRTSGSVILAIRVTSTGMIEKLECRHGHASLCRAALNATEKAQPFPALPEGTDHLAFEYQMLYKLY